MKIHHTAIWVIDLEAERDFFLKYFDCKASTKYTNSLKKFSSYFISFRHGGKIEIMKRDDLTHSSAEESLGYAHIALDAGCRDDVDILTERLRRNGVKVISEPRVTGDGFYESVILDPEDNKIEIFSD